MFYGLLFWTNYKFNYFFQPWLKLFKHQNSTWNCNVCKHMSCYSLTCPWSDYIKTIALVIKFISSTIYYYFNKLFQIMWLLQRRFNRKHGHKEVHYSDNHHGLSSCNWFIGNRCRSPGGQRSVWYCGRCPSYFKALLNWVNSFRMSLILAFVSLPFNTH